MAKGETNTNVSKSTSNGTTGRQRSAAANAGDLHDEPHAAPSPQPAASKARAALQRAETAVAEAINAVQPAPAGELQPVISDEDAADIRQQVEQLEKQLAIVLQLLPQERATRVPSAKEAAAAELFKKMGTPSPSKGTDSSVEATARKTGEEATAAAAAAAVIPAVARALDQRRGAAAAPAAAAAKHSEDTRRQSRKSSDDTKQTKSTVAAAAASGGAAAEGDGAGARRSPRNANPSSKV
jgi:hypothetical protein